MKRAILVLTILIATAAAQAQAPYKLSTTFIVGGEGGWDYITYDPGTNSLFIAHSTEITVVDAATGKKRGSVPAEGAHGIAIVPEKSLAFSTNGRSGTVTAFDAKTLQVKAQLKAGDHPDAIMYDEHAKKVLVMNGHSNDFMVIDPETLKVVATVPLGGSPEVAVADATRVYVNIADTAEIATFDAKTWKPGPRWKLTGCEEPTGLAIDEKRGRLFSACGNQKMVVVDDKRGNIIANLQTGAGTDGAVLDPALGYALFPNGRDGTLTVIAAKAGKYQVAGQVATQRGARTIALDTRSHRLYLPTAKLGPPAEGQRRPSIEPGTFSVLVFEPAK